MGGNYSREEAFQGGKLCEEIGYAKWREMEIFNFLWFTSTFKFQYSPCPFLANVWNGEGSKYNPLYHLCFHWPIHSHRLYNSQYFFPHQSSSLKKGNSQWGRQSKPENVSFRVWNFEVWNPKISKMATYKNIFYSKNLNIYLFHFESESTFALYQLLGSSNLRPWSFKLLSYSPSTTGLALRFTLVCHNSDDLFNAFMVFDHS